MIHEGDIVAEAKSPIDVICDLGRKPSKQEWYIVRETANKYNIAAKYRAVRDRIREKSAPKDDGLSLVD